MSLAEDPFRMQAQIEDHAGVLGASAAEVQAALDGLRSNQNVELWLAYVDTFSGVGGQDWTSQTAYVSDMGLNDVLMAVAVQDRAFFYSIDEGFSLTTDQMNDIMTTLVEPALSRGDWAGAGIAAANGIARTSAGTADAHSGFPWGALAAVIVIVVLAAAGLAIFMGTRRPRAARAAQGTAPGTDAQRTMTLEELRRRVSQQLVATDDSIKTSTEEVGFAIAEFGETEAAPFQKALEEAKVDLDEAFKLHRQYDEKADEETQRQLLNAVLQRTGAANEKLDAQVEHFDELRDLEKQAPQVLAGLESKLAELEARVPEVTQELAELAKVYAPEALKAVASNPQEAASRISFSREQVKAGLKDLGAKKLGGAAVAALAAQEAAGQAQAFLEGVGRLGKELGEARERIETAVEETQRDIAEARTAGAQGAGSGTQLPSLVATAEAAVAAAVSAAGPEGGRDPLAALRHLEEADAALEEALKQVRDEQTQRAKAAAALDRTLLAALAQIRTANDYIATHRGAVSSGPRELLAEAQSYADQAAAASAADSVTALKHASVAHELASRALNDAHREAEQAFGMAGVPGEGQGSSFAGAVLGGILASVLGGGGSGGGLFGGGGRSGGIFGGGGGRIGGGGAFGRAMSRGGGFAPPSFGGAGTRMRRGGGGRF
jgi:uncharacterized membrane protein YgcG